MYRYYFVTYFLYFVRQYVRWKLKEKVDTLIDFCVFSRVRVYTEKLAKETTFLYGYFSEVLLILHITFFLGIRCTLHIIK